VHIFVGDAIRRIVADRIELQQVDIGARIVGKGLGESAPDFSWAAAIALLGAATGA
jgi:hypothetical protein